MRKRTILGVILLAALSLLMACSRSSPHDELVIQVPAGYSGSVQIQLGVAGAPPLPKSGERYIVAVPPDGRVSTSTSISDAKPEFNNVSGERVWGYSSLILRTGDGFPVGGSIDFFVGTKEQYQMEVAHKHKSLMLEGHVGWGALSGMYLVAGAGI